MHDEYFKTHFRAEDIIDDWPQEFCIISACATTGQTWTPAQNETADSALAAELRLCKVWHKRITGYSPTTGHAEPSWAAALPFNEACDLGLRFKQDAIYHVVGDDLSVSLCNACRGLEIVGKFRERLSKQV